MDGEHKSIMDEILSAGLGTGNPTNEEVLRKCIEEILPQPLDYSITEEEITREAREIYEELCRIDYPELVRTTKGLSSRDTDREIGEEGSVQEEVYPLKLVSGYELVRRAYGGLVEEKKPPKPACEFCGSIDYQGRRVRHHWGGSDANMAEALGETAMVCGSCNGKLKRVPGHGSALASFLGSEIFPEFPPDSLDVQRVYIRTLLSLNSLEGFVRYKEVNGEEEEEKEETYRDSMGYVRVTFNASLPVKLWYKVVTDYWNEPWKSYALEVMKEFHTKVMEKYNLAVLPEDI